MWATPRTSDVKSGRTLNEKGQRISKSSDLVFGANLADQVKMWPTPTSSTGGPSKNSDNPRGKHGGNPLATAVAMHPASTERNKATPTSLNPNWVEWLMGYPDGWTSLETSQE
jgi:DNA (cytosine-5)-methyltransferase 1